MTALQAGQQLAGTVYQVVRELGAGGMGVVYEVEHIRLKKRYVAKIMHEQVRGEDGAQKRMEREAQVLADINHPNIVQVHDVGTTPDGTSYFVMEKLEGMDLRTAIKRGGVGRGRALQITIDILDALDHVHQRGIVHRDIKPENVFLARYPTGTLTKVLDFGIVHIFDGDGHSSRDRITKTGGFVGTLYYAAPEQMQGQPAAPSNDVYAAALVIFELLAGKGPFDDDPGVGLSRCFKPAPRIDALMPNVGKELADAIADALAQDPTKRPTASAFSARLRTIFAGEPTTPEQQAVNAEVDDLLQNMALQSRAGTAAPATPLMAGAPGRAPSVAFSPTLAAPTPLATAPTAYAAASAVPPPSSQPHRTAVSAQAVSQVDTSPGVYQTVTSTATPDVATGRAFPIVSAIIAVIVVLAAGGLASAFILKRGAPKPESVVAASVSAHSARRLRRARRHHRRQRSASRSSQSQRPSLRRLPPSPRPPQPRRGPRPPRSRSPPQRPAARKKKATSTTSERTCPR